MTLQASGIKQKLRDSITLLRPLNSFLAGFAPNVAIFVSDPNSATLSPIGIFLVFIAGFCVSAQGMVMNDYFDREADAINSPHRPIPSGRYTPREALVLASSLIVLGIACGLGIDFVARSEGHDPMIPFVSVWFVVVFSSLLNLYNWKLKAKGIIGNSIVAVSVSALFIYGDMQGSGEFTPISSTIAIAAFFFNLGREVIKGIADINGDSEHGITTVATLLGARGAALTGAVLCWIGVFPVALLIANPPDNLGTVGSVGLFVSVMLGVCFPLYNVMNPSAVVSRRTKKTILYVFLIAMVSTFVDGLTQL